MRGGEARIVNVRDPVADHRSHIYDMHGVHGVEIKQGRQKITAQV